MEPTNSNVPKHIGLILDGNRRFAKRLMLKPWKGHEWGAKKVDALFDWCKELGVREVTLYCLSIENFNRPKEEFDFLMDVFRKEFQKLKDDPKKLHKNRIRLNFIGRLWMLPEDIQEKVQYLMDLTRRYKNYTFNFAMAYGGRQEVVDAIKKIAMKIKIGTLDINKINEETFSKELYLNSEPELIIRTGGEKRTSNFLIWQGHYAEWIFLEKTWPEFEKEDFIECIQDFNNRKRRYGK